eukprot:3339887-Amphidinium_carterae.1
MASKDVEGEVAHLASSALRLIHPSLKSFECYLRLATSQDVLGRSVDLQDNVCLHSSRPPSSQLICLRHAPPLRSVFAGSPAPTGNGYADGGNCLSAPPGLQSMSSQPSVFKSVFQC